MHFWRKSNKSSVLNLIPFMIFMRTAGDQQCNGFECSVDRKAWEGNLLAKLRGAVGLGTVILG